MVPGLIWFMINNIYLKLLVKFFGCTIRNILREDTTIFYWIIMIFHPYNNVLKCMNPSRFAITIHFGVLDIFYMRGCNLLVQRFLTRILGHAWNLFGEITMPYSNYEFGAKSQNTPFVSSISYFFMMISPLFLLSELAMYLLIRQILYKHVINLQLMKTMIWPLIG